MESMNTEQLIGWNRELSTLLCMPVEDRENLGWQIAVGDHLEKFAKSWNSTRIAELENSLDEAEALTKKNAERMNGYLTREKELAAAEERIREHEAHENQTHEVLGKILGTDDTLKNVAERAVSRIAELESQIIHQTGISACRIEERDRLQKQITALKRIAITEKAYHIYYRCQGDCGRCVCSAGAHKKDARRQLEEEHPKLFQQIGE